MSQLLHIISNIKNRCTVSYIVQHKGNPNKKWVSDDLLNLIAERNRYHKLMRKYPNNLYVQQKYTEYCRYTCSMNNQLRRNFNSQMLNKYLHKPRQIWKCFNEIIHNKPYTMNQINSICLPSNITTNDQSSISNAFNDYFCSIGRELLRNLPHTEPTYESIRILPTHLCGEIQNES